MTVYVALLRAIGPGSHALMRPAALRDKAEAAGVTDPVNYLATGNLIFGSSKSAAVVQQEITALVESFRLTSSEVFLATRAQIRKIVEANPFPAASKDHPTRLGVCFFHKPLKWPDALLHPLDEQVTAVGSALVIDYGAGISVSKLKVEKLAGATMTQQLEHGSGHLATDEGPLRWTKPSDCSPSWTRCAGIGGRSRRSSLPTSRA